MESIEGAVGHVLNLGTIRSNGNYANGAGVQSLKGGTITNGAAMRRFGTGC